MSFRTPTIGFAGLSHLGLTSAIAAAEKGFSVLGYHDDRKKIDTLKKAELHIVEPHLISVLAKNIENIQFTDDAEKLRFCDIIYCSIDVPTSDNAVSDLSAVNIMIKAIKENIASDAVLVVLCQVPPGFTRSIDVDCCGVFYQVETLIFGNAISRALNPERIILGCENPNAPMPPLLAMFLNSFKCPLLPMRYESAELTKIAINCYLAADVTITNTLAEICQKTGGDWDEIIPPLKLDRRIGAFAYLSPGLGISGGNLERDLRTIVNLGESTDTNVECISSITNYSHYCKNWLIRCIKNEISQGRIKEVCLLGLSYKENTDSIKNSPAIELINQLEECVINAYDPAVPIDIDLPICRKKTIMDAVEGADVIVVSTPWPEFKNLELQKIKKAMRGSKILDPYRMLNMEQVETLGFEYHTIGICI